MPKRKAISPKVVTAVVMLSRRRCCLCVFLEDRDVPVRGQVAHLNRDRNDHRFDNLVWLCLAHHDEYDTRTSQAKGLTEGEVRGWRLRLVRSYDGPQAEWSAELGVPQTPRQPSRSTPGPSIGDRPWRYPLWTEEDRMDLFAFTAGNGADGICLIERIDLPDGRTVIACLQPPGNPGISITNGVEHIATQVCDRFEIDRLGLVWLEHYPDLSPQEWDRVTFGHCPAVGLLGDPVWTALSKEDWRALRLKPLVRLRTDGLSIGTKLRKLFPREH